MHILDVQVQTERGKGRGAWRLYGIGDPHLDKRNQDARRFKRYLDHIASDPYSLAICVGDVFDVTLPSHKFYHAGTLRKDVTSAMDQYLNKMVDEAADYFAPILKAGIPFICAEGNHDVRMQGVNAIQLLISVLNERAKRERWKGRAFYAGGEAMVRVRAPYAARGSEHLANIWTIYVNHGTGGGMQPGGKVNRAAWQAHICDADVYVRGHVEEADMRIVDRYAVSRKGEARLIARPVAYYTAAGYATRRRQGMVDYAGVKALPPLDRRIQWLELANPSTSIRERGKSRLDGGRMRAVDAWW
jgi:hypothetical protein